MSDANGGVTQPVASELSASAVERDVLDRLGAVVFRTDAVGNWTYLNRAWSTITGFSVAETLGTNFLDYVHPDEREHTIALFMAVVEGAAEACHHETRYRTAAGGYRWLELRATLLFDEGRQLVGNCGTLTDITARREAAEAIGERLELTELVASGEGFADLPYGALLLDRDLVVQRLSATARRLLGSSLEIGAKFGDFLQRIEVNEPGVVPLASEWGPLNTALRTGQTQYCELNCRPTDGSAALWLQTTVLPPPDPAGSSGQLVVLLHDVTDLRRAEMRQAAVAALGQRALEAVTLQQLLGDAVETAAHVLGTDLADLSVMGADGRLELRARFGWLAQAPESSVEPADLLHLAELAQLTGRAVHTRQIALPRAQGEGTASSLSVPARASDVQLVLQTHSVIGRTFRPEEVDFLQLVGGVLASAIQRRQTEDAAVAQSLHDPLTGLANRLLLQTRLESALRSSREDNRGLAILILDLDRFKTINDTFGHDAGDLVLRKVAARLVGAIRQSDTASRIGGDEFVVLLPGLSTRQHAEEVAAKVHASVTRPVPVGDALLDVPVSIGVAVATEPDVQPAILLKRADIAMYEAKNTDRDFVVLGQGPDDDLLKRRRRRCEYSVDPGPAAP